MHLHTEEKTTQRNNVNAFAQPHQPFTVYLFVFMVASNNIWCSWSLSCFSNLATCIWCKLLGWWLDMSMALIKNCNPFEQTSSGFSFDIFEFRS
jgi:hypothetical protein